MTDALTKEPDDEQQKHEEISENFLSKLSTQVPEFVNAIQERLLQDYELDVSQYQADHVCWRTETMREYSKLVDALSKGANNDDCTLLIESNVGGRPIATFSLKNGIKVRNRTINVLEVPAPKTGRYYRSGLEHVEFVIGGGEDCKPGSPVNDETHQYALNRLMEAHKSVKWETRAKGKEINPDISMTMNLGDERFGRCSVKFHLMPLVDVIKYEKSLAENEGML